MDYSRMVKKSRRTGPPPKRHHTKAERRQIKKKQVMDNIYGLPLDIKEIIHKMSINNHMEIWRLEHVERSKLTNKFVERQAWKPSRVRALNYISKFNIKDDFNLGGIRYDVK